MEIICPVCNHRITGDHINVSTDLAQCENCGALHKLSEIKDNVSVQSLIEPPSESKVEMSRSAENNLTICLPSKIPIPSRVLVGFIIIACIGFVALWLWELSQGNTAFSYSIVPAWVFFLVVSLIIVNSLGEVQTVNVSRQGLEVRKARIFKTAAQFYSFEDIVSIERKAPKVKPLQLMFNPSYLIKFQMSVMGGVKVPAIVTQYDHACFFNNATEAEKEWIVALLNNINKKKSKG